MCDEYHLQKKNICFFLLLIYSCCNDKPVPEFSDLQEKKLTVNESLVSVMNKEDSLLVKSVESYVAQCRNSNYNPLDAWFYLDSLSDYPYFELLTNITPLQNIQVLALTSHDGYKVIKLGFLKGTNIETILNIPAMPSKQMGYILLNYYDTFKRVKPQKFENITYFNHSIQSINLDDVKKMLDFGQQLSAFFKLPELKFDYYLFDNSKELFSALGYDYSPDMYSRYQSNSFSRPADLSIFSGNNSAYHPHELAHLYIHTYVGGGDANVGNPNRHLDEGFATYFGGAQGYSLTQSTVMAQDYLLSHDVCFETVDQLFILIDDSINFRNIFFGNLVRHFIEFYSPEYALQILLEYETEDELKILFEVHMLPDETFNEFVIRIILSEYALEK